MSGDETGGDAMPDHADDTRGRVQQAVRRVRREGQKAAAIHAVVEAAVVAMAVNLALTVVGVPLPGPELARQGLAVGLGLLVGAVGFALRIRRPLVERFEAVNPNVHEALRTARDAAADGAETRMARRLYADVLDELGRASSADLVSTRRVLLGVLLVVGFSVATVGVSVAGIDLTDDAGADDRGPGDGGVDRQRDYGGLQNPDDILGEETDTDGGDDDLDAVIGGSAGGEDRGTDAETGSYDSGGFSSSGSYEAQQAGFAASDDVENADIIREYNIRIRDDES